jgi:hypothetical protein
MGKLSQINKKLCGMTILQLNGEGGNNDTSFPDLGLTNHGEPTRVGGTSIVTNTAAADPFGRNKGVISFPGTGKEYLEFSDREDFDISHGDFTIEFWLYNTTVAHRNWIIAGGDAGNTGGNWHIRIDGFTNDGPYLYDRIPFGPSGEVLVGITNSTISVNTWYHFAFTREGNVYRAFMDGELKAENTTPTAPLQTEREIIIGNNQYAASGEGVEGYMSGIRIVKGHALYTKDFSVPTGPLPKCFKPSDIPSLTSWFDASKDVYNDGGSTLATDGQTVQELHDRASNNDITQTTTDQKPLFQINEVNGRPVIQFDGTNDNLLASSKLINRPPYTVVTVVKISADQDGTYIDEGNNDPGSAYGASLFYSAGANNTAHQYGNSGTGKVVHSSTDILNSSYHISMCLWDGTTDGGQMKTITDGVLDGLGTSTFTISNDSTHNSRIGARNLTVTQLPLDGYIAEMLIFDTVLSEQDRNRLERYLSFKYDIGTKPVKLCITDAGTPDQVLLLHGEGPDGESDILDSSDSGHTITPTGVTHDTSDKPYGFSSLEFNGTSDYLTVPDSIDWDVDGDFTIEGWVNVRSGTNGSAHSIFAQGEDSGNGSPSHYLQISSNGSSWNFLYIFNDGSPSNEITINATQFSFSDFDSWHHFACVKSGTTAYLFVDGKLAGTDTWVSPTNLSSTLKIGRKRNAVGTSWDYAHMGLKEFRWVKGTAVYTENFKPKKNFYCDN